MMNRDAYNHKKWVYVRKGKKIMSDIEKKNNFKEVHSIFNQVIQSIDQSKNQIVDLVNDSRLELQRLKEALDSLKRQIEKVIMKVDELTLKEKMARNTLAQVSKNFQANSEDVIRKAYEKASDFRISLKLAQREEDDLRKERTSLELAIKRVLKNIGESEQVIHQVSIAGSYLKGEILSAIESVGLNQDMMLGVMVLEAQENERRRISRDIHDGPAQRVANIVMKADLCEKIARKDLEEGLKELNELKAVTREALEEVRGIIYHLRPMSFDDLGLNKTLEMNTKGILDSSININYSLRPVPDALEEIIQLAVFRISQEIFNNIEKHAQAKNVYIQTEYGTKYMRLIIGDDGVGFDVNKTLDRVKTEKQSFGLLGLIERVEQLQGQIKIDSTKENGTIYNIKLPLNREVIQSE